MASTTFRIRALGTLLLICISNIMCAQIDSLKKAATGNNDSLATDALLQIGKFYFTSAGNIDSLKFYSNAALKRAEKSGNKTQIYQSNRQLAAGYVTANDTSNAFRHLRASINTATALQDNKKIADILHVYAALYGNNNMEDSALACFVREADYALKSEYYNALGIAYSSIGQIYRGRGDHDRALFYHRKALAIVDQMETTNMGNIIQVYVTSSQGYLMAGSERNSKMLLDSARILADSVLALSQRFNRLPPQASAYFVFANYERIRGNYEAAITYTNKALQLKRFLVPSTVFLLYCDRALAEAHLGNKQVSELYLDSASGSPALKELYYRNHIHEVSWQVNKLNGNTAEALEAHEQLLKTQDSLKSIEQIEAITSIEQKFNKAENEREILRLAHEQEVASLNIRLLITISIGLAILALAVFLIFRQRALREKQHTLVIEQRLNRARMDPHFLFNTFTALQSYILREKDPIKAAGFLSEYALIMRQTLESTYEELIPLEDEISYLNKYLSLQQMRTGGKFDFDVQCDDQTDPFELQLPGMIIQPFIENSVEHGFKDIDYKGQITVEFKSANNALTIKITDNGKGISEGEKSKAYPSRATGITRDRLELLNRKYKTSANYTVQANPNGSGTQIVIHLPALK
ncbi:MAG: histidine kinase [Bacteroidia bacterium]|nr:histidine kinase [Bacteroidia bacterium]